MDLNHGVLSSPTPLLRGLLLTWLCLGLGCSQPQGEAEVLREAEVLLREGQAEAAVALLEKEAAKAPNRAPVIESLAYAYLAQGDHTSAALTFAQLASLDPTQPEYLLYAAQSLRQGHDLEGAEAKYREYLERVPHDRPIWLELAALAEARRDTAAVLQIWMQLDAIGPEAATAARVGELQLAAGNAAQARLWYAQAAERGGPDSARGWLGLIDTELQARNPEAAARAFRELEARFPGALQASPLALHEASLRTLAAKLEPLPTPPPVATPGSGIQRPLAAEPPPLAPPDSFSTLFAQARQARAAGQTNDAIRLYKRALARDNRQAEAWLELAEAQLSQEQFVLAQAAAREAVKRAPESARATQVYLQASAPLEDATAHRAAVAQARAQFPQDPGLQAYEAALGQAAPSTP